MEIGLLGFASQDLYHRRRLSRSSHISPRLPLHTSQRILHAVGACSFTYYSKLVSLLEVGRQAPLHFVYRQKWAASPLCKLLLFPATLARIPGVLLHIGGEQTCSFLCFILAGKCWLFHHTENPATVYFKCMISIF